LPFAELAFVTEVTMFQPQAPTTRSLRGGVERRIARVVTVPPLAPGFVGAGHMAAQIVSPEDFVLNDLFIMLADDHLDTTGLPT
jgi:hypothetical protein